MDKAFVVLGEASESDDDEKLVLSVPMIKKKENMSMNKGVIIAGEASESESESEDTFREAFFARSGATENEVDDDNQHSLQYNTLLHKKLRECNASLHNSICTHTKQPLQNAVRAINTTNQQLLTTQLQVQDAASALSRAVNNLTKLSTNLNSLLATEYIPDIVIPLQY